MNKAAESRPQATLLVVVLVFQPTMTHHLWRREQSTITFPSFAACASQNSSTTEDKQSHKVRSLSFLVATNLETTRSPAAKAHDPSRRECDEPTAWNRKLYR